MMDPDNVCQESGSQEALPKGNELIQGRATRDISLQKVDGGRVTIQDLKDNMSEVIRGLNRISRKVQIARRMVLCRKVSGPAINSFNRKSGLPVRIRDSHPRCRRLRSPNPRGSWIGSDKECSSPLSSSFNYISGHSAMGKIADISPPFEYQRSSLSQSNTSPPCSPASRKHSFTPADVSSVNMLIL